MACPCERHAAVHPERFEHPVADDQSVVEHRHLRVAQRRQGAIDPYGHAATTSGPRTRRRVGTPTGPPDLRLGRSCGYDLRPSNTSSGGYTDRASGSAPGAVMRLRPPALEHVVGWVHRPGLRICAWGGHAATT